MKIEKPPTFFKCIAFVVAEEMGSLPKVSPRQPFQGVLVTPS